MGDASDWFGDCVIRKVGSGLQTSFWKDPWLWITFLKIKFYFFHRGFHFETSILYLHSPCIFSIKVMFVKHFMS